MKGVKRKKIILYLTLVNLFKKVRYEIEWHKAERVG